MEMFYGHLQANSARAVHKRERSGLAERLRYMRKLEQTDPSFVVDTSLEQYLNELPGLPNLIKYILDNGLPRKILEIGIGTGRALRELAQRYPEIEWIGTALTHQPEFEQLEQLGNVKVLITSAEDIRGISAGTLGGAYSIRGLGFASPTESAWRINRLLAPGAGLLSTSLGSESYGAEWDEYYSVWKYQSHHRLSAMLKWHGFKVGVQERPGQDNVIAAIKPNHTQMTPSKLLEG